jgi:hypothetical protein
MSKSAKIVAENKKSKVSEYSLFEIDSDSPPLTDNKTFIFSSYLTLNGDGVTNSMKVDGSTTPQDFYISAEKDFDIYITSLNFFIAAELVNPELGEFANIPPLTNGCQLLYQDSLNGDIIISDNLSTNFDLLRMVGFKPAYGASGTNSFRIDNVFSGNDGGYFGVFNFKNYGYDSDYVGGIRLKSGTTDKLIFRVRDNLNLSISSISTFDFKAYGFKLKLS